MSGSITKNEKTKKWDYCFDAGKNVFTGKRHQVRRRGFKTKREASDHMAMMKVEILNNGIYNISSMTLNQYMKEYFCERKIVLQETTFEIHSMYYRKAIQPRLGGHKLKDITPVIAQSLINGLVAEDYAPATVTLIYRILYGAMKTAKLRKLIKENPCENASLPRKSRRKSNIWTLDQVNYFLREAPNVSRVTRCLIGFEIGLLTGLRQGEILGLRWQDIDLEAGTLSVRQVIIQDGQIKDTPKNEGSLRTVTMPARLIENLRIQYKLINWEKGRSPIPYEDNDLVLPNRYGKPMIPRNFRKEFYNLTEKLNLPKIRFHDTRHTHATILIAQNIHIKLISERLGHRDIQTTLNTYSHVLPNMQRIVSDKLNSVIDF